MAAHARIRGFAFAPGQPPRPLESLEALDGVGRKEFFWIDVEGEAGAQTENRLAERMGWHPIVLQNVRQPSARPRMASFEDYSHIGLHVMPPDAARSHDLRARELDLVASSEYLISFHLESMPLVDQLLEDLAAARTVPKFPDQLLHRILARALDTIVPEVERMDDVIVALEEEALEKPHPELLERIVHARDGLVLLHLTLAPQLQIVKDLTAGLGGLVTEYGMPYFKSQENRLRGLLDDIAVYKEVAQNALELYRSSITQKTNETIRLLTVVSVPLLVVAFLVGAYGMNVSLPFAGHPHAFTGVMAASLVVVLGMLWWFRRRQWF